MSEKKSQKKGLDLRERGDTSEPQQRHVPMTRESRREVVAHAVRWAMNMLVEVTGNHHTVLSAEERDALKRATGALGDFDRAKRE